VSAQSRPEREYPGAQHAGSAQPTRLTRPAFSAFGIELEYMIVGRDSLDVRPIADRLLAAFAGRPASNVERGMLGWSNELVSHVVELKNVEPMPALDDLAGRFQAEIEIANRKLAALGARLLPTGMHPWMDPATETVLWQAEGRSIYEMYDRIFDCRRHGWANLQSMHINLPFADDEQFARLHAAIRLVLPLIPALAASTPIADGVLAPALDYRREVYRTNAAAVPALIGDVIPDTLSSRAEYDHRVLTPMYAAIVPYDPEGVLQHEWLNSRAAIPRFDRNAIEIRLADAQECPRADLAIAAATIAAVRVLYDARFTELAQQQAIATATLQGLLLRTIRDADQALIDEPTLLTAFGIRERQCTAGDVWAHLLATTTDGGEAARGWWSPAVETILARGPLARRILAKVGGDFRREHLHAVYGELARCLADGCMLV
jgi:gamma-glutamyl:cysteine ligase YbdK (ATP-grasp superfamily)